MFTTVCQKAKKKANLSVPTGLFLYLFVLCLFVCLFVCIKKKIVVQGEHHVHQAGMCAHCFEMKEGAEVPLHMERATANV